jgi:hypothetical protein
MQVLGMGNPPSAPSASAGNSQNIQAKKAADQLLWNQNFSKAVKAIPYQPGTSEYQNAFLNILASNPPPSGFTGTEATGLARAFTPKPSRTPFSMGLQNIVAPPSGTSSATPAPVMGGQPPAPPANAGGMGPASRFPIFDPEGTAKAPIAAPEGVSGYSSPNVVPIPGGNIISGGGLPRAQILRTPASPIVKPPPAYGAQKRQQDISKRQGLEQELKILLADQKAQKSDKTVSDFSKRKTEGRIHDILRELQGSEAGDTEDAAPPPEAKAAQGGYKVGGKYPGGLTYLGGDPNDESSWEKGGQ